MPMTTPPKTSSNVPGFVGHLRGISNLVNWCLAQCPVTRDITKGCNQVTRAVREFGEAVGSTSKVLSGSLARMALAALSMALLPVAANANGNMVDSFTYNGNQSGFTPGTVYAVSIAGTELNVCMFTPAAGTSAPSLAYNPSCQNVLANNPNSVTYTAVAYLGPNGTGTNFAVGDNAGNVYVMQIGFTSGDSSPTTLQTIQTIQIPNPDDNTTSCGGITSLAVDPNDDFLYVSCVASSNTIGWHDRSNGEVWGPLYGANLALVQITDSGSIYYDVMASGPVTPGVDGYFSVSTKYGAALSAVTGAVYPAFVPAPGQTTSNLANAVNPKLRVYPPNYPGLAGTPYYSTGGVFYSGIISGFDGGMNDTAAINTGLMCYDGACTTAYNIFLPSANQDETGGWIFTAAEYGVNTSGSPVLYWNQVIGANGVGQTTFVYPKTTNTVTYCQLNTLISDTVTSSPCSVQTNLQWPPVNVPSSNVWIDQLLYSPTPAAVANETSYTQGLLQMSLWNNGYLAYYDVAAGSNVPGLFMSGNGANGEVGANVQGLSTDSNGNLLIQAGASGLLGFNAFPTSSTNIETQSQVTYVPIPADTNPASSSCKFSCQVTQGLGIVASVITIIGLASLEDDELGSRTQFALHEPVTKTVFQTAERYEQFPLSEPDTPTADANDLDGSFQIAMNLGSAVPGDVFGDVQSDSVPTLFDLAKLSAAAPSAEVQCCDSNGDAPNPVLSNFLGQKPYFGTFTYSEKQMNLLGVRRGDLIKGMQLRLAEGVSAQPQQNLIFNTLQISMYSNGSKGNGNTGSHSGSTVFKRALCVPRGSYDRAVTNGYGPVIPFEKTYRYLGGDMSLTLRHSGSANSKRFYLEAFGGAGVSGAYAQLSSVWSWPTKVTKLQVAPQVSFIKSGAGPKNAKAKPKCN